VAEVEAAQQQARDGAPLEGALRQLVRLKGIATTSASVLLDEGLVWRAFRNRRQVGGFVGFRPVPYQSGEQARDQGIDRAGHRRLRAVSIQLAWNWVRWQPLSALTQWYTRGFGGRGARARRVGIVALARKLLIALWRYAVTGTVPEGAVLKAA
jgi:transposase